MPPLDTARRLIRALSLPSATRLARPGTNSASFGTDEFIDVELQELPDSSSSTPDTSRPSTPALATSQSVHESQLAAIPVSVLRYRSRAISRADSLDSRTSRTHSRSSSRSTFSSCDEVARKRRPANTRRESETFWRDYWD
ncbi:hypothetical protein SUNI508_08828 [Seiridium unicorne]|uniref:Uncharacterized protein n=1 Tax=Seiridium unicorne TaxID=138068 RepID=A0ABR2US28_9PEZI